MSLDKSIFKERIYLLILGAVFPFGFAPFGFWPASFLSLILLAYKTIEYCHVKNSSEQNKRSLFQLGLFWSLGAFGVGVSWVYVSIHNFGHAPVLGAIAISCLFVLTLSLIKASGFYLVGKLNQWVGSHLLILIIPFAWVVSDFAQRILFSGFPWLYAGYSQIDGPLWMLSTWIGVYGVTWFLLAIAVSLAIILFGFLNRSKESATLKNNNLNWIVLSIILSIPLLAWLSPPAKVISKQAPLDIALVQPNIGQDKKWDRRYFSSIVNILYEQSEQHWDADLIVWPEGAIPAYKHQVEDIVSDIDKQALATQTDLLLGLPVLKTKEDTSYAAFVSLGKSKQTYHKQVLVPFGEYVPLGKWLRGIIQFFNLPMSNFSPATTTQHPMNFANYQVIPAICYEIAYPDIVHSIMDQANQEKSLPKLIVTVSNDAWFGDSFGPYQHMEMARMRALELGVPLVRSTNDGITAVVDAKGNIVERLNRYEQATLRAKVSLDNYETIYRKRGLAGIYGLLLLSFVLFIASRKGSRKS
jgi:apolipoprotein N-acyltransferase